MTISDNMAFFVAGQVWCLLVSIGLSVVYLILAKAIRLWDKRKEKRNLLTTTK